MSIKEKIAEMYENGQITKNQAFRAAVFYEDLVKTAAAPVRPAYRILEALAMGGALGVSGKAFDSAVRRVEENKISKQLEYAYYNMLNLAPELRNNEAEVKNVYNTLAKFAPSLAADPHAAASYVKRVLEWDGGGADFQTIKALTELEKAHQQATESRLNRSGINSSVFIEPIAKSVTTSIATDII